MKNDSKNGKNGSHERQEGAKEAVLETELDRLVAGIGRASKLLNDAASDATRRIEAVEERLLAAEPGIPVWGEALLTEKATYQREDGATEVGQRIVTLGFDRVKKDKWGLPVLAIDCEMRENELLMRKDMMNDMAESLEAAGVKKVSTYDNGYFPGMGIHEMGTARMGRDPKTSVLNGHNQVWDAPNVFVTDGSCMTSSACQNPSLTYMALTARAAAFAVDELKKGNL